jgi:hypothetical protein
MFENMVHQVGFWYQALGLDIPESVTMAGANYQSPRMEVPDAMMVAMNQSEKLLFTWNSLFSNDYYGETCDYLFGTKGTIIHDASDQITPPHRKKVAGAVGYREYTFEHMQNFFDCVRSRKQPNCPFEIGFRSAIACQMAVASYRQRRTVRWDRQAEDIV